MTDLFEHQPGGVADVDFGECDAQGTRQPDRVVLGAISGRESGERKRLNVAARPAFPVHRARGDDQRVRRVQPPGNPDDDLRVVQRTQPLFQPGNLDVVGLIAILLQPLRIGLNERKTLNIAQQSDVTRRWIQLKLDAPERLRQRPVVTPVIVECPHPQPF
jgi:hypothetical protein